MTEQPDSVREVVFVTTVDVSLSEGHGVATKEIVTALGSHSQLELVLICPEPTGEMPTKLSESVDSIHWLPDQGNRDIPERLRTQLSLLGTLHTVTTNSNPDAIIARHSPTLVVPPLFASIQGITYIVLARGLSHERLRFNTILNLIFKLNVRLADDVYTAYEEIKEQATSVRTTAQPEPILFPNAVDPVTFEPADQTTSLDEIGLLEWRSAFVVGFVGSLRERHQVSQLIAGAAQSDTNAHLLIVGDGPERAALEQQAKRLNIEKNVHFTGAINHDDVPTRISACDVCYGVVDPDRPSNPIKIYEYLSCERPVITSDTAELSFVSELNLGEAVETPTPQLVSEAIDRLADRSESERAEIGASGREYILEHHTWAQLADSIVETL